MTAEEDSTVMTPSLTATKEVAETGPEPPAAVSTAEPRSEITTSSVGSTVTRARAVRCTPASATRTSAVPAVSSCSMLEESSESEGSAPEISVVPMSAAEADSRSHGNPTTIAPITSARVATVAVMIRARRRGLPPP